MSQITAASDRVAVSAHQAFLSSQSSTVHPVLQQIDNINKQYGTTVADTVVVGVEPAVAGQTTELGDEMGRMAQEGVEETISTEVFSSYRHREVLPGCKPHPGDIVEAGPLAALAPPDTYYPLADSLPPEVILEGKLSSLQLEGVIQACQRHQMILPNGQRAGFFIGDAAGVGKGRQIAGIILENFARGRTKSIWFTISADLIVDTRRDLGDLGCYIKVIDGCQELDKHTRVLGLPADFKEGVVFSTYATLVSSVQRGGAFSTSRHSRLKQLADWCGGEDFDGCLIFDECHKAKNFVPGKEQASTKIALAVTSIQRMLPKARVLYCSATGVTDVKNMAFMERLGMWGEGAPYKSFEQFLVSIQKKGLGMAEILAMEMKSSGMYVSRGLSYKQAEFLTVEAVLTKEQRKVYDTAVHVWNEIRKALESAVNRTVNSSNRVWANFWACHQRFFKQLCLGMKVPTIVKEAKEAIEDGYCIVIGLQTTGEASLDSELSKTSGNVTGFMSLCREMLSRFLEQSFPTKVPSTVEGEIKEDPWCVTAKKMLLEFAKKITLPSSPLDEIIDQLGGPSNVAEMTGRKGRIVRQSEKDPPMYETRTPDTDVYGALDSLNVQERNMFMEGKKLVAIISDAASTGISLHADHRVRNQKRRIHLTVELPWSADKAVQQLGRSHRSNQSSGPLYKLLTTDLGGERRFAAAVARRLQSLGALTKGDRRAATGADLTEFNFDTPYGRNALRTMYAHICRKQFVAGLSLQAITQGLYDFQTFNKHMQESLVLMGLVDIGMLQTGPVLKEKDTGDVSKFLNRILGLTVEKQNMIFTYFTECLNLAIQSAKKEGRYNEGLLDIAASSVEMVDKPVEIFKDYTKSHTATRLVELNIDRGMSWDQAVTRADLHTEKQDGFYISRRDVWGRKLYVLATQKENSTHLFRIARPNTGLSAFDEEKTDLLTRYQPIGRPEAEKGWKKQFEKTRDSCVHGSHCKNKGFCKVGSRCYRLHLLCGSIVSMMNVLESTLNRYSTSLNLSKSESTIRVVRVQLNDGERVVGVRYPKLLIKEVEKALKEQKLMEYYQQQAQIGAFLNRNQMSSQLSASQLAASQLALSQLASLRAGSLNVSHSSLSSSQSVNLPASLGVTEVKQTSDNKDQAAVNTVIVDRKTDNGDSPVEGVRNSSVIDVHDGVTDKGNTVGDSGNGAEKVSGGSTSKILTSDKERDVKDAANDAPVKAVIEAVAPVVSKCLSKAMRPPVTIKNFFKTASKSSKSGSDSGNLSSVKTEPIPDVKISENDNSEKNMSEMSYEEFLSRNESDNNCKEPNTTTEKDVGRTGEKKEPVVVNNKMIEQKKTLNGSSGSRKRTNEGASSSQPSKRAKQVTLFSSFQKMNTKKEKEEKKDVSCPICGKQFEKGISNADLNSHIDNCIIE